MGVGLLVEVVPPMGVDVAGLVAAVGAAGAEGVEDVVSVLCSGDVTAS